MGRVLPTSYARTTWDFAPPVGYLGGFEIPRSPWHVRSSDKDGTGGTFAAHGESLKAGGCRMPDGADCGSKGDQKRTKNDHQLRCSRVMAIVTASSGRRAQGVGRLAAARRVPSNRPRDGVPT